MPTDKVVAQKILERLSNTTNARIRPMMGEYLVYADDVLIGQINEGELFIKVTVFGSTFAASLETRSPYSGAKPAYLILEEMIADAPWLSALIQGTVKELSARKKAPGN
jgi:TfoX/Sxy family transcriptional regulator of competence genes